MHQERLLLLRHQKWTVHVSQKQFLMDQISSSLDNVKGGLMAVNARVSFSYSPFETVYLPGARQQQFDQIVLVCQHGCHPEAKSMSIQYV